MYSLYSNRHKIVAQDSEIAAASDADSPQRWQMAFYQPDQVQWTWFQGGKITPDPHNVATMLRILHPEIRERIGGRFAVIQFDDRINSDSVEKSEERLRN